MKLLPNTVFYPLTQDMIYLKVKQDWVLNYSYYVVQFQIFSDRNYLRILAMYEAENSKISNFCTFWPLIQLINHL